MVGITQTEVETEAKLVVDTNLKTSVMESWKVRFTNRRGSYSMAPTRVRILREGCYAIEDCLQQMAKWMEILYN